MYARLWLASAVLLTWSWPLRRGADGASIRAGLASRGQLTDLSALAHLAKVHTYSAAAASASLRGGVFARAREGGGGGGGGGGRVSARVRSRVGLRALGGARVGASPGAGGMGVSDEEGEGKKSGMPLQGSWGIGAELEHGDEDPMDATANPFSQSRVMKVRACVCVGGCVWRCTWRCVSLDAGSKTVAGTSGSTTAVPLVSTPR